MATNTVAIHVGRLLEVRADAGYRTVSDVNEVFDAIDAELRKLPRSTDIVVVVDWRNCPVMESQASERVRERIMMNNARTERSAALASPESPVAVLQFVRLIRESQLPDRKMFYSPSEVVDWLKEVLTPAETERLQQFLAEVHAPPRLRAVP